MLNKNLQNSKEIVDQFLDHLNWVREAIVNDHYLIELLAMEPDPVIQALILSTGSCVKCGSATGKTITKDQEGLVYECTDCPTTEEIS